MLSNNLAELLAGIGSSIQSIVPFGRTFLNEVISIRLGLGTGSIGGVSSALLTLAVLAALTTGDPSPTPTPTPLPF